MPELPISGFTSQKQVTLHRSELCVRHAQCARKLVCALNTSRLTEQIRGSEILNCLCHFLCRSSTHRTDFFLPSGKFGIPYSKWKGLFSKSGSWSFSVVPWTCQAFALCHTWLSQVPKATHGYMARKKHLNTSRPEETLFFQKDTYGQSCTTAWRATHFPALFCSFFQNQDHPRNKIKSYSVFQAEKQFFCDSMTNYTLQSFTL